MNMHEVCLYLDAYMHSQGKALYTRYRVRQFNESISGQAPSSLLKEREMVYVFQQTITMLCVFL